MFKKKSQLLIDVRNTRIKYAFSAFGSLSQSFLLQFLNHFNVDIRISSWTVFFYIPLCLHQSFDHLWSVICVYWFYYTWTYFTFQVFIHFLLLLIVKIVYKCWVIHSICKMLILSLVIHEIYLIRGTSFHLNWVYLPFVIGNRILFIRWTS